MELAAAVAVAGGAWQIHALVVEEAEAVLTLTDLLEKLF
jgi:hypothetical protein